MRSIQRLGKTAKIVKKATLTPPPWQVLDGALLECWREAEEALRAWMEAGNEPVSQKILDECNNDESGARSVQAFVGAQIFLAQWKNAEFLLENLNPGSLANGHRRVKAMIAELLGDKEAIPAITDDVYEPEGRVATFARRAFKFQRAVRTVMRADAKGKSKERAMYVRTVEPAKDLDKGQTTAAE